MADYAPPPGPPPPTVPAGWKAVWNDQYKEWFYVNTFTKQSQWNKPTEPVYGPSDSGAPPGPPPGYDHSTSLPAGPEKGGLTGNAPSYGDSSNTTSDEALARKLQAEEEAKAGGSTARGAADSYYQGGASAYGQQSGTYGQGSAPAYGQPGSPYGQNTPAYGQAQTQTPSQDDQKRGGFFSKLTNKLGGGAAGRPPQQGYGSGYPPQQSYGQQYPQQGYGGYPPQQSGYYPPQASYQQQQQQQQPAKRHGLGAGGGALLGAGAGILGGALLMDAIEDHDQAEYNQGFEQGQAADDGGNYGGDDGGFGGDDGGDFGGDF